MPSPFPGMDPWLEDSEIFGNLHDRIGIGICNQLNRVMPDGYTATTRNRVWVEDARTRDPDVSVFGQEDFGNSSSGGTATLVSMSGLQLLGKNPVPDEFEELFIEIRSNKGRRLVTAIEILSLSNKTPGNGRKAYLTKQQEYLAGSVNLVEIDLLRAGLPTTLAPRKWLQRLTPEPFYYHVCATTGESSDIYGGIIHMQKPLPTIGIMLDPGVPTANVDLQPILDEAYDLGRYKNLVDYTQPPEPPLTPAEMTWANDILRAKQMIS
jgi:Protein of unknown function (DUF4058)